MAAGTIEELPVRKPIAARPHGTTGAVMDPLATDPQGLDVVVPAAPPVPPRRRRRPVLLVVLALLAVAAAAVGVPWYIHASGVESTDDAAIDGKVIAISPQVSARVLRVLVDDNKAVKKDQPMVELDRTDYQIALEVTQATEQAMAGKLEQARQAIVSARAMLESADAEVQVATANRDNAHADYDRYVQLNKTTGAVSKQQFDQAGAAERSNAAQLKQAEARRSQAAADIKTQEATAKAAEGDLAKARADVHKAEVNLGYCTIVAPSDGKVTRKNVEAGAYVQVGQELFAVVPPRVWVVANYKETQLARMRPNQRVNVDVDAYPGMHLHGYVESLQSGTGSRFSVLPAENATGNFVKVVQRIPVKILLDGDGMEDPNRPLVPGMSVEPEVEVK